MVNPQYISNATLAQIKDAFHSNKELPSITLQKFFSEQEYLALSKEVSKAKFKQSTDRMHMSCGVAPSPQLLIAALNSQECKALISSILGITLKKIEGKIYQFPWKGYTLLHDDEIEVAGIDIIFDLTPAWDHKSGGMVVYVDGTGDSRNIPSSPNTLSITSRQEGVQKFVEYINHYAKKSTRTLFFGKIIQ